MVACRLTFVFTGNWDPKIQETRYSTKIPTAALRAIAGFDQKDVHWNPRTSCLPPEELKNRIFPWLEREIRNVQAASSADNRDRATASATLKLWQQLREVILQDAAALLVLHPERKSHMLFRDDVFRDPMFVVS